MGMRMNVNLNNGAVSVLFIITIIMIIKYRA